MEIQDIDEYKSKYTLLSLLSFNLYHFEIAFEIFKNSSLINRTNEN